MAYAYDIITKYVREKKYEFKETKAALEKLRAGQRIEQIGLASSEVLAEHFKEVVKQDPEAWEPFDQYTQNRYYSDRVNSNANGGSKVDYRPLYEKSEEDLKEAKKNANFKTRLDSIQATADMIEQAAAVGIQDTPFVTVDMIGRVITHDLMYARRKIMNARKRQLRGGTIK